MDEATLIIPVMIRPEDIFWENPENKVHFSKLLEELSLCKSISRKLVISDSSVFKDLTEDAGFEFVMTPSLATYEPAHMGPPGRRISTSIVKKSGLASGPIVFLNFRNINLLGCDVDAALAAFAEREASVLMSVRSSEDHPCQLFAHRLLLDVGYLTVLAPEDEPLFARSREGDGAESQLETSGDGYIFRPGLSDPAEEHSSLSLRLTFMKPEGQICEVVVEDYSPLKPFGLLVEAREATSIRYTISAYEAAGEYCGREPYGHTNGLWEAEQGTARVRNSKTGKKVRGRQDFPDVYEPDDSIVIVASEAVDDFDRMVAEGKMMPYHPDAPFDAQVCSEFDYLKSRAARRDLLCSGSSWRTIV